MKSPWTDQAQELADWTIRHLVNRDDVHGFYLPVHRREALDDPARMARREVTRELLMSHFAFEHSTVIGLYTTSRGDRCRWLVVDIDRHDDEGSHQANEKAAIAIFEKVMTLGGSAFLEDSNGRGGFHLWIIFNEPISAATARRFGQSLIDDWKDLGLNEEPEVFPKQDQVEPEKFGHWVRLPGHHHTEEHWSKIWDGRHWLEGEAAARWLLSISGSSPNVLSQFEDIERRNDRREQSEAMVSTSVARRWSIAFIRHLLLVILPNKHHGNYKEWLDVGIILKHYGQEGLELWEEWSRRCTKYRHGACGEKWSTIQPGELTPKKIIMWARNEGWRPGDRASPHNAGAESSEKQNNEEIELQPNPGSPADNPVTQDTGWHPPDCETDDRDRVIIPWNEVHPADVINLALEAIRRFNKRPEIFQQGGRLVRLRQEEGVVRTEVVEFPALRERLINWTTWVRSRRARNDEVAYSTTFPVDTVIESILAMAGWPQEIIPQLKGVVRCPVFTADGKLIDQPGYNRRARLWYEPAEGLTVPPVPPDPSDETIKVAVSLLCDDLLGGFPFDSDADLANALAYLLTPFARNMISGPVPLGMIDAPVRGTGKTLLAQILALVSTGMTTTTPTPSNDEEWRKSITAILMASPQFVIYDNIAGKLFSPKLEQALTSSTWSDRELQYSRTVTLPINCIWLGTANNPDIQGDLHRRIVSIRLDAKMEWPEDRKPSDFRHKLPEWAEQNRAQLIWAALVIIQAWIARGRPPGSESMSSYQAWAETLGGVLRVAGTNGFLGHQKNRRDDMDEQSLMLKAFFEAWRATGETENVGVKDHLYELVEDNNLLPGVLTAPTEGGRRRQLGHFLRRNTDRVAGNNRMIRGTPDHSGLQRYSLTDAPTRDNAPTEVVKFEASCPWGNWDINELLPTSDYADDDEQARNYRSLLRATRGQILFMDRACRELQEFKMELWATHRDWLIVSDVSLLHFAESEQHLSSWLTGRSSQQRLAQLRGAMRYAANLESGNQSILSYDEVNYMGRQRSRYLLDLEPRIDRQSWLSGHPAQLETAYQEVCQFLHDWWRLNHTCLAADLRIILKMIEGIGLLGTRLPLDRDYARRLRRLDEIMQALCFFEFDGFMIWPDHDPGDENLWATSYRLTRLPGHESPPFERQVDDRDDLWRRHRRYRKVTPADFLSLIE